MMIQLISSLLVLSSPLLFILLSILPSAFPKAGVVKIKIFSKLVSIYTLLISAFAAKIVFDFGTFESAFIGINKLGFSIRLDSLSATMFGMIAILSFIILKFSFNYLDGDKRQDVFLGRLAATIASVQLMVLSGNIAVLMLSWIFTSMSLHRLLVFYSDRAEALVAAKKKYILARLGDLSLLIALSILYIDFRTGDLGTIFNTFKTQAAYGNAEIVAVFLAITAILKSAQFPSHGWLLEVMETPTPVSALLHAGLLNAGPFLILRMSFIMESSAYAPMLLIAIGGFTALFASLTHLTQTSIKTALAYSSIAHMGFSLMLCGMGVYAAAMLHLVAHSFYKAHAFLSSGSILDTLKGYRIQSSRRKWSAFRIFAGVLLALTIYSAFALIWGIDPEKEFSLLAIGCVIVVGLSQLFASVIDSKGNWRMFLQIMVYSVVVSVSFFSLENVFHQILSSQVPEINTPGLARVILISTIFSVFVLVSLAQTFAPIGKYALFKKLAIHLRNGLYANMIFDRLIGSLKIKSSTSNQWNLEKPAPDYSKSTFNKYQNQTV